LKIRASAEPAQLTESELAARVQHKTADILKVPVGEVRPEALWIADLEADSLDLLELATAIESDLGIRIEDDELVHLLTVQDACDLIWKLYSHGR
jgi:acyl carrier protein